MKVNCPHCNQDFGSIVEVNKHRAWQYESGPKRGTRYCLPTVPNDVCNHGHPLVTELLVVWSDYGRNESCGLAGVRECGLNER